MALLTLPFLYVNLGGEMLYILNQRLTAQKSHVSEEKRCKVMRDIVDHMLRSPTVDRLFIPKPLATSQQLKTDFTKLAHASIMKLNDDAMEKLFDLMQMAVKYQVMMCKSGDELLLVTLNHLDGIRKLVGSSDKHISSVDQTCIKLTEATGSMNASQFMMLRHVLLGYFQGYHKKVSIFLSTGIQRADGLFILPTEGPVPQHCDQPGTIRYSNGKIDHFTHPHQFTAAQRPASTKIIGDRVITLGNDMYSTPVLAPPTETKKSPRPVAKQQESEPTKDHTELRAKAELDFLQHLLIGFQSQPSNSTFKLSMFDDDHPNSDSTHRGAAGVLDGINTIRIDGSKSSSSTGELGKILSDFESSKSSTSTVTAPTISSGDDLLSLMDAL